MSSRIAVEEWRTLLCDELEFANVGLRKTLENIAEGALAHPRNAVLYRGVVQPFIDRMEADWFTLETAYFQHYWRSLLEVLRVIA